jgi:hypothetical protein
MTTSALVLIPSALLLIVLLLGFTGCAEIIGIEPWRPSRPSPPSPPSPSPPPYSDDVLGEESLVAYWPLGEQEGETIAVDVKGAHNGAYEFKEFPDYPAIPPENPSAAAPGTLNLGQPGIVAGDIVPPPGPDALKTTCIEVNGGFVSVPFDAALNPEKFSVEAWVHVGWSADSPPGARVIVTSFDVTGGTKGFGLFANEDNIWKAYVGTDAGVTIVNGPEVILDTTNHIVLTYDGADLRLYLNGTEATIEQNIVYQPSTESKLLIGVGAPHLAPEERFPWVGKLQCVALYNLDLTLEAIVKHYQHGNAIEIPKP